MDCKNFRIYFINVWNNLYCTSNSFGKYVSIKKPIKYNEIVNKLSNYDIGIFYNEPTTFNLRHSLPNKIFEFIQARLAVAIAPSPDMKDLVEKYDCGVVAADFDISDMARSLNLLTESELDRLKKNSHIAAAELNIEKEQKNFLKILKVKLGEL